jgi:uncharacterized protein
LVDIVVSDTSPIRALVHMGHVSMLREVFGEVLIPPAVVSELEQPRSHLTPVSLAEIPFLRVQSPQSRSVVDELSELLGPGESEAIALAMEVRAEAVLIDESAGRAAALRHGLLPVGVLGVLLLAKQRGLIGTLGPLLDRLQSELGFFITAPVRQEVLARAGEI